MSERVEIPEGFTPGEWWVFKPEATFPGIQVGGRTGVSIVVYGDGAFEYEMQGVQGATRAEAQANARLIAAAPAMAAELTALRAEVERLRAETHEQWLLLEDIDANIDLCNEIGGERGADLAERISRALWGDANTPVSQP